jgi:hypothetical protein
MFINETTADVSHDLATTRRRSIFPVTDMRKTSTFIR